MANSLNDRKQIVVLNNQHLTWVNVKVSAPRGSILVSLLSSFFTYFFSNLILLSNGTSLFSVIYDEGLLGKNQKDDLNMINNWACQWKMIFNSKTNKQSQEVILSYKVKKSAHLPLIFK